MVSDKFPTIIVSGQEFCFYQTSKKKGSMSALQIVYERRRESDNISLSVLPHETMNTEDPDRCADLSE